MEFVPNSLGLGNISTTGSSGEGYGICGLYQIGGTSLFISCCFYEGCMYVCMLLWKVILI